jgi:tRNA U34 5-methylaminomethyl-2-thiouridine-forming methyltransferase MnmC
MTRELVTTKDGSHSIAIPDLKITYHSVHGAIQESRHVFIEAGLNYFSNHPLKPLYIFEMGLGTGLNALLTAIEAQSQQLYIHYTAVEPFPLSMEEVKRLNYSELLQQREVFEKIHESNWQEEVRISEFFIIRKEREDLGQYSTHQSFNLIYYDAFAPLAQPELWTKEIFDQLFRMLLPDGILVTYCSKGDVRRAMIAAGFEVKKLPGPPGKREMIRAIKILR